MPCRAQDPERSAHAHCNFLKRLNIYCSLPLPKLTPATCVLALPAPGDYPPAPSPSTCFYSCCSLSRGPFSLLYLPRKLLTPLSHSLWPEVCKCPQWGCPCSPPKQPPQPLASLRSQERLHSRGRAPSIRYSASSG